MKTLSKDITSEFFESADDYIALERRWRELMNDRELRKQLRCSHHLLYAMLRGKDWRKALTPPTNATKLVNGALVSWVGRAAYWSVRQGDVDCLISPFGGTVTGSAVTRLREMLPECKWNESPLDKEPYLD